MTTFGIPGRGVVHRLPASLAIATVLSTIVPAARAAPPSAAHPFPSAIAPARLTAQFWIERAPGSEQVLLAPAAAAGQNARVVAAGPGLHDPAALPPRVSRTFVTALVEGLASGTGARPVIDGVDAPVADLVAALALDRIPSEVTPRFALAVRRADLRSYPTSARGRSKPGDTDIDRFQESALFPGTPVAVLHETRDGRWAFVLAPHYAAWVAADALAVGPREEVFAYAASATRMVTGPAVRTVQAPLAPALSDLVLDMGVAVPEVTDWPPTAPVNGQGALGALVVRLPTRAADGALAVREALLPRGADTHVGPLPVSRANLLRQAFKFVGERYCWGHGGSGRDCSGFVAECHRSLGLVLPRNSKDQAACTASFRRTVIPATAGRDERLAALASLAPGDLIHVPGHVMMVVGADDLGPWIIHDSHAATVRGPDGMPLRLPTNSVVVCPLEPLLRDDGRSLIDSVTVLQRYLPDEPIR